MASSVWKGYISFGLVSFPIHLTAAARREHVELHMLHKKDLSRVKEVWYCAEENKPIDRKEIVKGYETGSGEYVVVEGEDIKGLRAATGETIDIIQFVKIADVDPIFFEKSYYVAPEEAVSKPYFLLLEAMKETSYAALAKIAMHGREHVAILRPAKADMLLHMLYYVNELHLSNRQSIPAKGQPNAKELTLAKKLIDSLVAPFNPKEFHDNYRQRLEKLIEQKQSGEAAAPVKKAKKAPVVDIMEALKQSLAKGKSAGAGRDAAPEKQAASKSKPKAKKHTRRVA